MQRSAERRGQIRGAHTAAQLRQRAAKACEVSAKLTAELTLGVRSPVGERLLGELPHAFIGVELGG
jgi:hypothetical protein